MTYIDEQPHIHWKLKDLSHVDVANNNKDPVRVRVSVWLGLCLG